MRREDLLSKATNTADATPLEAALVRPLRQQGDEGKEAQAEDFREVLIRNRLNLVAEVNPETKDLREVMDETQPLEEVEGKGRREGMVYKVAIQTDGL